MKNVPEIYLQHFNEYNVDENDDDDDDDDMDLATHTNSSRIFFRNTFFLSFRVAHQTPNYLGPTIYTTLYTFYIMYHPRVCDFSR